MNHNNLNNNHMGNNHEVTNQNHHHQQQRNGNNNNANQNNLNIPTIRNQRPSPRQQQQQNMNNNNNNHLNIPNRITNHNPSPRHYHNKSEMKHHTNSNNNHQDSNHLTEQQQDSSKQNRFDEHDFALWKQVETYKIWKMLNNPEYNHIDPRNPYHIVYNPYNPDQLEKEQMARRMDRKVIKLEAAYGSERQTVYVKRNQDLIVRDLFEEVQNVFKIPFNECVVFHKGTNLTENLNQTLESLGIENNHQIRVTRDPDLPFKISNKRNQMATTPPLTNFYTANINSNNENYNMMMNGLDSQAYLKEISPQRVPDPTPYQVKIYNQQLNSKDQNHNDVIKLYVSFGSEREYLLVHGKKPLVIHDLKLQLNKSFKIPIEQQCIVYKGFNLHEYLDDAPLEAFGLENNSQISLWPRSTIQREDLRLPRDLSPPSHPISDVFSSPRGLNQPIAAINNNNNITPRKQAGNGEVLPSEVLKIEVQHGSDRHYLILRGLNKTLTVLDLQNEMERMTAVAVKDQRIFFKSQELHMTPFKTLKECDLENNNLVKLVGEPSKLRYSNFFGKLNPSGGGGGVAIEPNDPNFQKQHPNLMNNQHNILNQPPIQYNPQQQQQRPMNNTNYN